MITSLLTISKAQDILAQNLRERRVSMGLTQEGLAKRSGVRLPTLRKFEQKGLISLESFLKLAMVLGGLEDLVKATQQTPLEFSSIDDVLKADQASRKQRGTRKKEWRT